MYFTLAPAWGVGSSCRSAHGFSFALRGLGFRRVRPRILEAARAPEMGGVHGWVDGYRLSTDVRRSRLGLGNTGFRSLTPAPLLIHIAEEHTNSDFHFELLSSPKTASSKPALLPKCSMSWD